MKISLKNSGVLSSGEAIQPTAANMEFGELAVNYSATDPAIFIKDNQGNIRRIAGKGDVAFDNYLGVVAISATQPFNVTTGNLWWDTDDERVYIFTGTEWKDASKLPFDENIIPDLTDSSEQAGTFDDRYIRQVGGTLTGNLNTTSGIFSTSSYIYLDNSTVQFKGDTDGQGDFWKIILDAETATTSDITVTLPATTGTVITTGDSNTVTGTMIANQTISNANISSSANIAFSKLATGTLPTGIKVNSNNITDGSITDADISSSAAIALTKLAAGTLPSNIQVNATNLVSAVDAQDIGAGALPNDVTVSSANIVNNTIVNDDISNSADIYVSKLASGTTGQLLTSSGGTTLWASNINIPGTLGVTGASTFSNSVTINGSITVDGSSATFDTADVRFADANLIIGNVASPTNFTADGGGLTLLNGGTNYTWTYSTSSSAWESNRHINVPTGYAYRINGTTVLSATALGNSVTSSNLTSVGTITSGTWEGNVIDDLYIDQLTTAGKVANSATTATSLNSGDKIVLRDANGDFAARNITASLSGNASTATTLQTTRNVQLTGDVIGSATFNGSADLTISTTINSTVVDTDLSWNAANRVISSSTGDDATITLFDGTYAGLVPASGGGTTNFLRADGTWVVPPSASTNLSYTASTGTINSSTGTGAALPTYTTYNRGLVPASGGGTTKFLRADGTWVTIGSAGQGADLSYDSNTREVSNSNGDGFTIPEVVAAGDSGLLTGSDKTKLDGIASGAEVNVATNLAYTASTRLLESSTGDNVTLPEATTSFAGLLAATDKQQLEDLSSDLSGKADLVNGRLDSSQLPDLAITEYLGAVSTESAMLALSGEKGDWAIRTDNGKVYVITGTDSSVIAGWTPMSYPAVPDTNLSYVASTRTIESSTGGDTTLPHVVAGGNSGLMTGADKTKLDGITAGAAVTSVNGQTGAVTISGTTNLSYTSSSRLLESSTGDDVTLPLVVASGDAGLISGADKTKLDGIETGAEVNPTAAEILTALATVDGSGSGLDADTLDGSHASNFASLSTTSSQTITGALRISKGIEGGYLQGYKDYSTLVDFGSDAAGTERRIISASLANSTYSTIAFNITVIDNNGNHAPSSSVNNLEFHNYTVTLAYTDGTTVGTPDTAYIKGPDGGDLIRARKISAGNYEVTCRNEAQYREYRIDIKPIAVNASHVITYYDGDTPSSATASYTSSKGNGTSYFGAINATGVTLAETGNLVLSSDIGANSSYGLFDFNGRIEFDADYSDTARGPNKIQTYLDMNWVAGLGIHSNTAAYYSGGNHAWYKSNSTSSYTEVMSLSSAGVLTLAGTLISAGTSGKGARLGNLKVGYDNLYNTVETDDGTSNLHLNYNSTGDVYINQTGKVWHSGNDGAGSGLDADRLDGHEENIFMRRSANSDLVMNNQILHLGASNTNSRIRWSGTTSLWDLISGDLKIRDGTTDRFTFGRTTGDFTASGTITAQSSLSVGASLTVGGELNLLGGSDSHKYLDARVGNNSFHIRGTSGGDSNHENMARFTRNAGVDLFYDNNVRFSTTNTGAQVDAGTSTTFWVKCDDGGNAIVRASGEGQGTGVFEVGQSATYGGGMSYNGDNTPAFASGESSDAITFYRLDNGTRTEVFSYPYNSNVVTFNSTPTVAGSAVVTIGTITDYSINPKFGTTIGFGNDTGILYFDDATNTSKTDYWTNKDRFEIRGDSNSKGNVVLNTGNLLVDQNAFVTGRLGVAGRFDVGPGGANSDSEIRIYKNDNDVSDHLQFYNGTTRIGEIGTQDSTWLRINQVTNKNIYTPRYIRADNGFFVDGTTKGINGSGNFVGGTIAGASDYGTLLRADVNDTAQGEMTFNGRVNIRNHADFADDDRIYMGSSDDWNIYRNSNDWTYINDIGNGIIFQDNGTNVMRLEDSGVFRPETNNTRYLGTSSYYWEYTYSKNIYNSNLLECRNVIDLADNDIIRMGSGDDAIFFCNGSHFYLDLKSGIGNFYIRDGSSTRFTFDDAGHFTATGNITAYSDIQLKENISNIEGALEKVKEIRGVTYDPIEENQDEPLSRRAGVIAQEIEKVLPEVVTTHPDGLKSVAYGNLTALLIEAIKELTAKVEALESK